MGYDRGDSFLFNFDPNGIPFDTKLKGKLSPRSYPIECERKLKYSFLSVFLLTRGFRRNLSLLYELAINFYKRERNL